MTPLATHLRALGLTNREAAALLGVAEQSVSSWASGYRTRDGERLPCEAPRAVMAAMEAWRECPAALAKAREAARAAATEATP